jgi:hypothetical protein
MGRTALRMSVVILLFVAGCGTGQSSGDTEARRRLLRPAYRLRRPRRPQSLVSGNGCSGALSLSR